MTRLLLKKKHPQGNSSQKLLNFVAVLLIVGLCDYSGLLFWLSAKSNAYSAVKLSDEPHSTGSAELNVQSSDSTKSNVASKQVEKGPAIAFLVPNAEADIDRTLVAFQSLDEFLQDDKKTPLLIFNEGDLSLHSQEKLRNFTNRRIHFPLVNFSDFPRGFDPNRTRDRFQKRTRWGYWQMCRFWISRIWDHSILNEYSHG